MKIICPSCNHNIVYFVGQIPATNNFAGVSLPQPMSGGSLYRCEECNLYFRYPSLLLKQSEKLYRLIDNISWTNLNDARRDWALASEFIESKFNAGKILDVGCFDGGFLEGLRGKYQLFGIEANVAASENANSRGVEILGNDFECLSEYNNKFDIAIAIDVIEHVSNPFHFLKLLANAVRKDGIVILSTGNTDSLSWKFMGSRYWYCTLAEHVSFINLSWCEIAAIRCGLKIVQSKKFSHSNIGPLSFRGISEFLKNSFYKFSPSTFSLLRKIGFGSKEMNRNSALHDHPPLWISSKDHIMIVMKKIEN